MLTFASPRIFKVGSSPTENISLNMVEPTNVLIPEGRGNVTMMANDTNMASQTSTESLVSRSTRQTDGTK